jgi:hypothetical protein
MLMQKSLVTFLVSLPHDDETRLGKLLAHLREGPDEIAKTLARLVVTADEQNVLAPVH